MSNISRIHLLKKMTVRITLNVPHTLPLFIELRLLPVSRLFEYTLLKQYISALRFSEPSLEEISNLTRKFAIYDIREGERWEVP